LNRSKTQPQKQKQKQTTKHNRKMMLKVLALLFVSLSATRALPQDFTVSLSSLTVALDDNTPTSEAIKFAYSYLGPTTDEDGMVSMEYAIYEGGCGTIYADDANTQNAALYRNLIDQNGANNTVDVNVEIDLATIEAATGIWQQASNTYAELHFCGRLEIYFGDNSANAPKTFVNYHETDVEAQITLTEAGGMHVDNVIWDLVERAEDSNLDNAVQVDYPVVVFKCDENAIADPTADTAVNQGDEINLCVKYAGSVDKVYVESIDKFSYWSVLKSDGLSPTTPELVWENGNAKNLVIDVTCNQELGVCRINFLVDASLFIDAPAAAMQLQVNGLAVIAVSIKFTTAAAAATFFAIPTHTPPSLFLSLFSSELIRVVVNSLISAT
jgi:hypothetical protein